MSTTPIHHLSCWRLLILLSHNPPSIYPLVTTHLFLSTSPTKYTSLIHHALVSRITERNEDSLYCLSNLVRPLFADWRFVLFFLRLIFNSAFWKFYLISLFLLVSFLFFSSYLLPYLFISFLPLSSFYSVSYFRLSFLHPSPCCLSPLSPPSLPSG